VDRYQDNDLVLHNNLPLHHLMQFNLLLHNLLYLNKFPRLTNLLTDKILSFLSII